MLLAGSHADAELVMHQSEALRDVEIMRNASESEQFIAKRAMENGIQVGTLKCPLGDEDAVNAMLVEKERAEEKKHVNETKTRSVLLKMDCRRQMKCERCTLWFETKEDT